MISVGFIIVSFKTLLIKNTPFSLIFFQISDHLFIYIYIFSWIFIIFSIFFLTRIANLRKFETKKLCWLLGVGMG
jgi:hypothetical protein